jgi:dihydrofolate reductase
MKFSIVVAHDSKKGIGKNNSLPWRLSGDLKHFKQITCSAPEGKRNAVIMGRKTWDSLPLKFKPLPGRLNIVVSRQTGLQLPADCRASGSLEEALLLCRSLDLHEIFVVGGAELYSTALFHKDLRRVYLTEIQADFQCDRFFPDWTARFNLLPGSQDYSENGIAYSFRILEPAQLQVTSQEIL